MDMSDTRIGFACLAAGGSADVERARKISESSQKYIQKQEPFEVVAPETPVSDGNEASAAAELFRGSGIDALVIQFGTFAPDALSLEIISSLNVPVAMWALPEPPLDGVTPRCGSMAALMMHSSTLKHCNRRFGTIIGDPESSGTRKALDSFLGAVAVRRTLRSCIIGLFERHSQGFYSAGSGALAVKDVFGATISPIDSSRLSERFEHISPAQVEQDIAKLSAAGWADEVEDADLLEQSIQSFLAIRALQQELALDAISMPGPCEGMHAAESGACLAQSRLTAEGVMADGDCDIDGLLTMLVQHLFTGRPVFSAEWVEMDERSNQVLFWNAGGAPEPLVNPRLHPSLRRISSGQGCVAVELPLKSGEVTVARLIAPGGRYKLLTAHGRAVDGDYPLRGACVNVKLDCDVHDLFETILENGFPHRYALVYQDITGELQALADVLDIDMIAL